MPTSVLDAPTQEHPESPAQPMREFAAYVLDEIRGAMGARGITAYRLIKVTGLADHRVYRVFRGEYPLTVDELFLISLALDVAPEDLVSKALRRYDEAGR